MSSWEKGWMTLWGTMMFLTLAKGLAGMKSWRVSQEKKLRPQLANQASNSWESQPLGLDGALSSAQCVRLGGSSLYLRQPQ